MQFIWCFVFLGFLTANAITYHKKMAHLNGISGVDEAFPNEAVEWKNLKEEKTPLGGLRRLGAVNFLLYTNSNPDEAEKLEPNYEAIRNSRFDPAHHNVFFIHGWRQNRSTSMNTDMRYAYFGKAFVNFWFVEWKDAGKLYVSAKNAVPEVGERLANMYDHLVLEHGVPRSRITIVGHSLGAHVAGFCGKRVTSGKMKRIYGLDPAAPLYLLSGAENRFDSTDAEYVEQITTNAGHLGLAKKIGHVAIYVNGGKHQPGCGIDLLCSHRRSVDYFIESIVSPDFLLVECATHAQALVNNCGTVLGNVALGAEDNYLLENSLSTTYKRSAALCNRRSLM